MAEIIVRGKNNFDFLDIDTVLAGALLHDVGKFLEFAWKDGEAVYSGREGGQRHPKMGADLAERMGVPQQVCDIIRYHSVEGEAWQHTKELQLVRSVDLLMFDLMNRI